MTPKQQLLERAYPGDVASAVAAWVAEGKSWREVARLASEASGIEVSHESMRSWYGTVRRLVQPLPAA